MCSLVPLFENVLENCKQKCAVTYWDDKNVCKSLSYEEVNQFSQNITNSITRIIKEKHVCVGLYMEHNPYVLCLVLSLQKCGFAFIFLDPYSSDTSNLNIIKELNLEWIISINQETYNSNFLSTHSSEAADLVGNLLTLWKVDWITNTANSFETICYVVCTSGTTGKPKIVKVQTECIASNIRSLGKKFKLTEDDVIYFGTPLTFDPSMVELFLALTIGASLLIAPAKLKINPARLLEILFPKDNIHKGATVLQIVPSLFLRWSQDDIEFILQKSTCRVLAFGGEKFPEEILYFKKSEHLEIFNLYGITEVSCWASVCAVTDNVKNVPLGDPLEDTILEVRNDVGSIITNGEGELYVGSFSRICYVTNEENQSVLTKPVYRSTGDLVRVNCKSIFYVCRNNRTIKRLGHKVNLSEVEEDIFKQTNIPNVCVWLQDKNKLVLFVAVKEHNEITKQKIVDKFRIKLLHSIPKQCFPDRIEIIPKFPLTKHGKIDRKSLEEIYNKSSASSYSKNAVEVFEFLWSKYSAVSCEEIIKYYDCNFFEVGGNSVSAIQYLSEFQSMVGVDYPNDLTIFLFEKTLKECLDFIKNFKALGANKRKQSTENCDMKDSAMQSQVARIESNIKIKICWRYNLEACVDSSPILIKQRNSTMIAIGSFSHIFAVLDSENGNAVSQIALPDAVESACCASPSGNHLFVGCYDGKMYSIETLSGRIIWQYSTGDRIKCTPCLCLQNEAVAFGSYDKHVHCVNIQNGTLVWKTFVSESVTSNLVPYMEKIYVATTFGTCLCLSENSGDVQWKCTIGSPIFGSACLYNSSADSIIWPDVSGILHSFSCASGEKQWTFQANGNIYSSVTRHDNLLIFGSHDHNLYCVQVNGNGSSLKYKVLLEHAINSTPCVMQFKEDSYIIAASNHGSICVIDLSTGKIIQDIQLPGQIFSSPVIKNNCIYVGCRDNNLYCLSIIHND